VHDLIERLIFRVREKEGSKLSHKQEKENAEPNFKSGSALPVLEDDVDF